MRPITSTEDHPNRAEILAILARTVELGDDDLRALALAWKDDLAVAQARDKALRPDSPLIVEVLTAFDSIASLFADDLAGDEDYVQVPPPVTALALKAVRDAVAAAYARPVLDLDEHALLVGPWRSVFPEVRSLMPDFGPQHAEIVALLARIPGLACHSHDARAAELWENVRMHVRTLDREQHEAAIEAAWQAAILSGRRRLWALVSRSAQEGYGRTCPECSRTVTEDDVVVLSLCLGAGVGLLVRDLLDEQNVSALVTPVAELLEPPRAVA